MDNEVWDRIEVVGWVIAFAIAALVIALVA